MAKQSHTPSRRAMLAGLAAAPVAGLPAIAGVVVAEHDPLLGALAEYERLHAIEQAAWKAAADASPTINRLPEVVFNGERVFSILQLETMRERSMGMTDEELDDTIARLRKGNAMMRNEAPGLEPEYRNARAVLEAHEINAENAEKVEALEAESAAQKAQDDANEAQREVFEATPTTGAGALRLLRHLADFLDEDDVVNDIWVGDLLGEAIRNAAAVLEQEALS
jgi:hypothetical protein